MAQNDRDINIDKGIVSYFVNRPLLVNIFLIMVFLTGGMAFLQMQRDQFPEIDMKRSIVMTSYPGASAEDVELKVTKIIEDRVRTISNIKRFYSTSISNTSIVVVDFVVDLNKIDAQKAKADLRAEVKNAESSLPTSAGKPSVTDIDPTSSPIVYYMLFSDHLSNQQLREAALELENSFRGVEGIKDITKVGFRNKEYQVLADTQKMDAERITLSTINTAIANYNIRNGGGSIDEEYRNRNIVTESLFGSVKDVANLTLRENFAGENVKVKQIGEVNAGFAPSTRYARSERSNGILLQVQKKQTSDIITTVDALDATLNKTQAYFKEKYGAQLNIVKTYDTTVDIRDMLSITWENGWVGFVLVYLIMWAFLDMRTAWWAAFNIPVSMFMTFLWIYSQYGYGFNMITMFGLITVIGIVVDQGIVVAENIYQKIEQGLDPKRATIVGTNQIARAILAAVAITIAAFIPLLLLGDMIGQFLRALPTVVVVALIASTIEVFISLPSHIWKSAEKKIAKELKKGKNKNKGASESHASSMGWFSDGYKGCLRFILKYRYLTILVSLGLLYSSLIVAKHLPFIFFSDEEGTTINATFQAPQGYTLDQTYRLMKEVENQVIEEIPYGKELRTLTTQVGIRKDDPMSPAPAEPNTAFIQILLTPFSERSRNVVSIANALRKRLAEDKFISSNFEDMTISAEASGPPSDADFQWRISTDNRKLLKEVTDDMEAFVKSIKGVYGVDNSSKRVQTKLQVHMRDDMMNRLGVNPSVVSSTILTAYDGSLSANYIPDISDPTYVRLSLAEKYQRSQNELPNLLIPATRNQVRLKQVADIKEEIVPYMYRHYNGRLSYTLNGFVDKTVNTPLKVDEAIRKVFLKKYANMPNLWITQSGEGETMSIAFAGTSKALIVALIAILVILLLTLNSFAQSMFLIFVIPFSLIGVFYGFYFQGSPLGFFAMVGVLGLAGVVVNHAVVLVDIINHRFNAFHINKEYTIGYQDFLIQACETRLRPIILTTLCTVLGLIPAIYGLGGSNDFLRPLAIALADGLLVGMLVTIFLIPCFYHIQRDFQLLFVKLFSKKSRQNQVV